METVAGIMFFLSLLIVLGTWSYAMVRAGIELYKTEKFLQEIKQERTDKKL